MMINVFFSIGDTIKGKALKILKWFSTEDFFDDDDGHSM